MKHRPFNSMEEFEPYRGEWFIHNINGDKYNITGYGEYSARIGDAWIPYDELFESMTFESGEPAGVKI